MTERRRQRWNPFARLTAAGSVLVDPRAGGDYPAPQTSSPMANPARPDAIRARAEEWQKQALAYRDTIPEVGGGAAMVRASIESVQWVVKGTGYRGGRQRAQDRVDTIDFERMAELIWLSGESWLAVPRDSEGWLTPARRIAPYSLSVEELNTSAEPMTVKGPNGEQLDQVDPVMRIWRKSVENRWKATSPLKASMDLLEAMYLSQRVDTATQRSRLIHAGIVFWPTNAPNIPVEEGEEPVPGSRQALDAEFKSATDQTVSMHNRGQEPATPFIVYYDPGPTDVHYKPEMFRVERDDLAEQYATRMETYGKRFAIAAELPTDSISSMAGANRFSVHQIDVDKVKTWLTPLCELIRVEVEAELVKLYGPGLTLECDFSKLIAKPDQTEVIMKLATLQIVTPESAKAALEASDLSKLVMREAPQTDYTSNVSPGQPSDFGVGNTDRGGGKFTEPT